MWVSKKKWEAMEKRIDDLEAKVQSQLSFNPKEVSKLMMDTIQRHREATHDNAPKCS